MSKQIDKKTDYIISQVTDKLMEVTREVVNEFINDNHEKVVILNNIAVNFLGNIIVNTTKEKYLDERFEATIEHINEWLEHAKSELKKKKQKSKCEHCEDDHE